MSPSRLGKYTPPMLLIWWRTPLAVVAIGAACALTGDPAHGSNDIDGVSSNAIGVDTGEDFLIRNDDAAASGSAASE